MYRHAINSAAQPNSSLKAPILPFLSLRERNSVCPEPSSRRAFAGRIAAVAKANYTCRDEENDFGALGSLPPRIPSSARGHASGPFRRPAVRRRSAFSDPPGTSLKSRGKKHRSNFFRAPAKKALLGLGSRAHSLASRRVSRAGYGKFNETEVTTMYQNKVTLIGFLGNDAEVRTNNDRNLTVLSLATKSSYKKDGKYIEHTEWHRCVAFAKLGEFAATLKKGAHIQVEGELRSRKYNSTKSNTEVTVWEIRVNSILKLDRAQKATAEDDDAAPEEEAA